MSLLSSLFGSKAQESKRIAVLNNEEYKAAVQGKNVQLVDVRTANEYKMGHIENAINIDFFNSANFLKSFGKLDKEKPVYLYCQSGNRSYKAAKLLLKMGFSKIFDLRGGYVRW